MQIHKHHMQIHKHLMRIQRSIFVIIAIIAVIFGGWIYCSTNGDTVQYQCSWPENLPKADVASICSSR